MSDEISLKTGIPGLGTMQSQLAVGQGSIRNSFLHTLVRVRGTNFGFGVLYEHSQQHRLAKGAKVWVKVKDRSELHSGSVVDLRVVDMLVVDVKFDMDEMTTIGLSVIET